jgi:hypothetical protein
MDENSQQIKAKKLSIVFRDGRFHRKTPHIENTKEIKKVNSIKKVLK